MNNLDEGFKAETDNINKETWQEIIQKFDDANLYQTWEYGQNSWGENELSHLVLKLENKVVAAAQVRVKLLPIFNAGFAHVSWGPMWRLKSIKVDLKILKNILRALANQFTVNKKLLLRIRINELDTDDQSLKEILKNEGYKFNKNQYQYRTIRLNLNPDIADIRKNLHAKWREQLNKAERQQLTISQSYDQADFDEVAKINDEMIERKNFSRYAVFSKMYKKMHKEFPDKLKMRVFRCFHNNQVVAGQTLALFGNTGIPVIGSVTADCIRLKLKAAHLLHWSMIVWLKENGFKYYDLRGYNPEKYPGPSSFKYGVKGDDLTFMGTYEKYKINLSLFIVRIGEFADICVQETKSIIYNIKNGITKFK